MPYNIEDLIRYRIRRGRETADEAKMAIDNGRYNLAENRIYYAMFYMVQALAIKNDFKTSKHTRLLGWFNKEFVRTGLIEVSIGKAFQTGFEKRQDGDYDDFVFFEKEEVEKDISEMVKLLDAVEALIHTK